MNQPGLSHSPLAGQQRVSGLSRAERQVLISGGFAPRFVGEDEHVAHRHCYSTGSKTLRKVMVRTTEITLRQAIAASAAKAPNRPSAASSTGWIKSGPP